MNDALERLEAWGKPATKPFSLTCLSCGAGDSIKSAQQAIDLGWTELTPDVPG